MLACLAKGSEILAALRNRGRFALNVLASDQRHFSDRFAAKGANARAHEVAFLEHDLGLPIIPDALATIACDVEVIHPAGDHEIVVAKARHLTRHQGALEPPIFYRGAYSRLAIEKDELAA